MRPHRPAARLRGATLVVLALVAERRWGGRKTAQAQVAAQAVCKARSRCCTTTRIGMNALNGGRTTRSRSRDPAALSCADAATWLSRYLQDYDGVLPSPWIYDLGTSAFTAGDGRAFTAPARARRAAAAGYIRRAA